MSIDNATPEDWTRAAQAASAAARWSIPHLDEFNRAINRPFYELPLETQCCVFALWRQGYPLAISVDGIAWSIEDWPSFGDMRHYAVQPKPEELVLPSIDWSGVSGKFRFLTQGVNDALMLWTHHPRVGCMGWHGNILREGGCAIPADYFTSAKAGRGDWRKLIVQRPEGV